MNHIENAHKIMDEAFKSISKRLEQEMIYGKWVDIFYYTYSKRYNKSYLWCNSQFEKLKIVEYT